MAMFGNKESKEEKQDRKAQELLSRFGLEELKDERDLATVRTIANEMAGNSMIEIGTALKGNAVDSAKMSYLRAILEQNWIIIRQLDRMNATLEHMDV